MKNKLKILDLFSGIGGFSLGLERTGQFKTVAFCEIDKYCKLLLQKHWKGVKIYDDVKEITQEGFKADGIESPDIITGGFPCQPFSVAGKQKGTSDNRHLWPEMFRIIKAFKPRFIIGENVRGIINIQDGVVFEAVCTDLESEGYEVQPFIIPAAGVGAPHRRERVWIIAIREESMVNSDNIRFEQHNTAEEEASRRRSSATFESTGDVPNTESFSSDVGGRGEHQEERDGQRKIRGEGSEDVANTQSKSSEFFSNRGSDDKIKEQSREETGQSNRSSRGQDVADTERIGQSRSRKPIGSSNTETNQIRQTSRLNDGSQGTQGWWDVEPDVGRVAHGVSGRVHRLRALGNSIIPQIAEEIGKAIINMERRKNEERH